MTPSNSKDSRLDRSIGKDSFLFDAVCEQYGRYKCALCNIPGSGWVDVVYRIIPDSVKGRSQAQWLVDTQLGPQFQLDDPDNCLPLCTNHAELFNQGSFVLCPPLRDLQLLLDWEIQDQRSRSAAANSESSARTVPPPQKLSGNLCFLWISRADYGHPTICGVDIAATGTGRDPSRSKAFPQHIFYQIISTLRDDAIVPTAFPQKGISGEIELSFNHPGKKWRINPYAALVRAMELIATGYTPAQLHFEDLGSEKPIRVANPVDQYKNILLQLHDLYSTM